ncbi:hypothetical protein [Pectinatus frisingensis]|uniref:hypothetical protein n=1 Tax=Pectinatus frisingensis TaxID=865 RepID=UPI0018C69F61|nr:hypothetical protein [Pectinatus frisingensis]
MGTYISLYNNNPTAAGVDGSILSEDGTQTAPLIATLNATKAESLIQKCAVRCAAGYKTAGNTTISFNGANATKWSIAPDNNYADATAAAAAVYANTLTITDIITAANNIFWIKTTSSADEQPQNDVSVSIQVNTVIASA